MDMLWMKDKRAAVLRPDLVEKDARLREGIAAHIEAVTETVRALCVPHACMLDCWSAADGITVTCTASQSL